MNQQPGLQEVRRAGGELLADPGSRQLRRGRRSHVIIVSYTSTILRMILVMV